MKIFPRLRRDLKRKGSNLFKGGSAPPALRAGGAACALPIIVAVGLELWAGGGPHNLGWLAWPTTGPGGIRHLRGYLRVQRGHEEATTFHQMLGFGYFPPCRT